MSYLQVRDLLETVLDIHNKLAAHFAERVDDASDPRVIALLERSAARAREVRHLLGGGVDTPLLDQWLQYDRLARVKRQVDELALDVNAPLDEVVAETLAVDEAVLTALSLLPGSTGAARVDELFERVAEQQRTRVRELAQVYADLDQD